jgi:serine/threonine protein kinase
VVHERYRVVRAIGEGAMGAVYEVARLTDERRFALKVLTSATTGAALARLAREAQVAAKVTHERLVSIADVDVSEGGTLYIVMELVDGVTLVDLRDRYGDAAWALPVLRQVATGLAVLHDQRIVHRDLKPANVLVGRPGDLDDPGVKIADFGIAQLPDDEPGGDDPTLDSGVATGEAGALTGTGILLGTPLYMAPELAKGARDAKPSSDLWAFGVLAFELLAGALPFEVPPVLDAMANRRWNAPRALDPARCGAAVAAIVARCLHAEPESRPTAGECLEALQASSVGVASSPMSSTRS